jgi:metal-responsive CopG/Arc/MetJ family transcriptional regulator
MLHETSINKATLVQVSLPASDLEALDAYRREQRNPPSRARAAKDLIRAALERRDGASECVA